MSAAAEQTKGAERETLELQKIASLTMCGDVKHFLEQAKADVPELSTLSVGIFTRSLILLRLRCAEAAPFKTKKNPRGTWRFEIPRPYSEGSSDQAMLSSSSNDPWSR